MGHSADIERILEKTTEYLRVPAVVGYEEVFLRHLERDFSALGAEVKRTAKLLTLSGGKPRGPRLSCHIDRHGILCTARGELQYAAHAVRSQRYGEEVQSRHAFLRKICQRFVGEKVWAYDPESGEEIARGSIAESSFCEVRTNLIFEIPGLEDLAPGTPVSYAGETQLEGDLFRGQLDNVISAAAIFRLFELGFRGSAIFTAEEEIGQSWRHLMRHLSRRRGRTAELLVLDTSPFDSPAEAEKGVVVLRRKDGHGSFNPALVGQLAGLCADLGIPYLLKDQVIERENSERTLRGQPLLGLGSTELGRVVEESRGRLNGATVQLPTFHYHSNRESTHTRALEHWLEILRAVLEIPGETTEPHPS